jgi:uncharacterized protein
VENWGEMRLLIDTNVFLEIILDQEKAEQSKTLLENTKDHEFFISDYSLHSIGLLLFRRKQHDIFKKFLIDMISNAGMKVIGLSADNMQAVVMQRTNSIWTLTMLISIQFLKRTT